jgi:hypothetical protein
MPSKSQVKSEIKFIPNPLQKKFIESRAKADLFSSRMGEGKSAALAWSTFYHTRHNPGARWALIRDTWENMQATTLKTFFEWFQPGVHGTFHQTKKTFTWASGMAEGEVEFLGMDDPQDASKLMSRELGGFGIDEPAPAVGSGGVDEMIFDIAMSRLRQKGMNWYGAKLAENNPDEAHWTYRKFVQPGTDGYVVWQPTNPENIANLPPTYYEDLRKIWSHRPDLLRRFVEGEFGFQQEGRQVTPQWSDKIHLATGLTPIKGVPLHILWDFGHNPTAIFTQRTPLGSWLILDAMVGDNIGVEELILDGVIPLLAERYPKYQIKHIGDPAGNEREQTSVARTAVRAILDAVGGSWRSGPVATRLRIDPLQAVLSRTINGMGLVRVDRHRATPVWHALRGGWHYHVARSGIVSGEPKKNMHSHPGDAMGYGAAVLFPLGKMGQNKSGIMGAEPKRGSFFEKGPGELKIGPQRSIILPKHGEPL